MTMDGEQLEIQNNGMDSNIESQEVVVQESNNDISTNVSVKKEVTDVGIINSENKDIVEEGNGVHLENGDISENGEVLAPSAEVEEKEDAENMEKDIVNNDVLENNTLTVADQENDIPQEISQENPGGGTLLLEEPCPSDPVIAEQESTCPSSALPDVENQTIAPSPEDSIPIVETFLTEYQQLATLFSCRFKISESQKGIQQSTHKGIPTGTQEETHTRTQERPAQACWHRTLWRRTP